LLHNPLANLIQDLLYLLIHTLAIHGYTPMKPLKNVFPSTSYQRIRSP